MSETRWSFRLLIFAWGMLAIMMQSMLLRESHVLMFGCEFTWGVVLSAWLLGIAMGGFLGGWFAPRTHHPASWLCGSLILMGILALGELYAFRTARSVLSLHSGELLSIGQTSAIAFCLVTPFSSMIGFAFPLACRLPEQQEQLAYSSRLGPLGDVYGLESAGSLIGGALFSFWLIENLSCSQIILNLLALIVLLSGWFLINLGRKRTGRLACAVALTSVLAATFASDSFDKRLQNARWQTLAPDYKVLLEKDSRFQNLAVLERADQYSLFCDGHIAADFPDPWTFVPLAHFWMCQHPQPQRVLIIGGGAEGLLAEIIKYPQVKVDYIEPDPQVMTSLLPFLTNQDRVAIEHPAVTVHHCDARHFIKTQKNKFDLVIARLQDPTSALRARYFTSEFYDELRNAMTQDSVLGLSIPAAPGHLEGPALEFVASVNQTLQNRFREVIVGWGNPAQVLAATKPGLLSLLPSDLTRRFESAEITTQHFHPAWFDGATDWLVPGKVNLRKQELESCSTVDISTDNRPIVFMQRLAAWDRLMNNNSPGIFESLRRIPFWFACLVLIGGTVLFALLFPGKKTGTIHQGTILLSIAVTGFASMGLSIIWLFAFQNLYGYVYQRIGWIIALFMAGLVIGCWFVRRRTDREKTQDTPLHLFILTDFLFIAMAATLPLLLHLLKKMPEGDFWLIEMSISLGVAMTGLLCGSAFALAGGLSIREGKSTSSAAGWIVAADHAGACLGALLTGVILVPVFGIASTAWLIAGMKVVTAVNCFTRNRNGAIRTVQETH